MPAPTPIVATAVAEKLSALGQQIRAHRKLLRVSATDTAQAASMSRVTLHRIENGEASVTMGAYLNVMAALSLDFGILKPVEREDQTSDANHAGWIPARVRLSEYPQLKQLAWQVHGTDELTPAEALSIYERNARHLDVDKLQPRERQLIDALRLALAQGHV
jgi:transcriptional regulator with XRE-family HTH domain